MGRPIVGNPLVHDMKFRVDDETFNNIDNEAKEQNITRSEVIRKILNLYFNKGKQ